MTYNEKDWDFQKYLKAELEKRVHANANYSMRAFARFLNVQPGFLSKMLKGERTISVSTVENFGERLHLSKKEMRRFSNWAKLKKKQLRSPPSLQNRTPYYQLKGDHYLIISHWYHYAILELTSVKDFNGSADWIANSLGLEVNEVRAAIDRLERLGFIEFEADGKWKLLDNGNRTTLGTQETSEGLCSMQKQFLQLAMQSIDRVQPHLRDNTSMTMAIDPSLITKAKKKITKFRRELTKFLESGSNRVAVYNLSISLFPVKLDSGDYD